MIGSKLKRICQLINIVKAIFLAFDGISSSMKFNSNVWKLILEKKFNFTKPLVALFLIIYSYCVERTRMSKICTLHYACKQIDFVC